jgi:hypothetical protein
MIKMPQALLARLAFSHRYELARSLPSLRRLSMEPFSHLERSMVTGRAQLAPLKMISRAENLRCSQSFSRKIRR